jgi:hypothetical protein
VNVKWEFVLLTALGRCEWIGWKREEKREERREMRRGGRRGEIKQTGWIFPTATKYLSAQLPREGR